DDWPPLGDFSSFEESTGLPSLSQFPLDFHTNADVRPADQLGPLGQVPYLPPTADPDWVWPARIRRGEVTLLAGEIGAGKSFLACDLAARLSSGRPWPDAPADAPAPCPGQVLLVVGLESNPDVLKDRLRRLGADPRRVQVLRLVQEDSRTENCFVRSFNAERDLGLIARHLLDHGNTELIILDSIDRLAGPRHSPAVLRRILDRLQAIAATSGAAILLTKTYSRTPRPGRHLRALGSLVFADSLRSLWAIEKPDPETGNTARDACGAGRATHRLVPLKVSDFERSTSLDFRLHNHRLEWLGAPQDCPALHHGEDPVQDQRRCERNLLGEATDFLRSLLEAGPVHSVLLRQYADRSGLAWRTVQRAKERLGIESSMSHAGDEHFWTWWLPGTPTVRPPDKGVRDLQSPPAVGRREAACGKQRRYSCG
ncbi:MAG: AAA family ATPase, partial [Planctomycetaceae bacterium]